MKGWSVAAVCAAILGIAPAPMAWGQSNTPTRFRPFWEAAVGGALSDNVYHDSRQEGARGYDLALRAGLRSRFTSGTFARLFYDIHSSAYRSANVENRTVHSLGASLKRLIGDVVTANLAAGVQLSRFPNLDTFDSTVFSTEAGLTADLSSSSTLGFALTYEKRSYPNYDLDYGGGGASVSLERQLDRRTRAALSAALQRNGYSERRVAATEDAGDSEGELRTEADWVVGADLVRDLTPVWQLGLSYEMGGVSSNGDSSGMAQGRPDSLPDDERVLGDYFSHRRHEVGTRLRWLIRRGSTLTIAAAYLDRAYTNRLATDEEQRPLDPEERRHDHVLSLAATWEVPLPRVPRRARALHPGLRLQLLHETSRSNETLYHCRHNSLVLSLTSWY